MDEYYISITSEIITVTILKHKCDYIDTLGIVVWYITYRRWSFGLVFQSSKKILIFPESNNPRLYQCAVKLADMFTASLFFL